MLTKLRLTALTCAIAAAIPAHAGEREDLEGLRHTTMALIQMLVEQGVLNREKADDLIRRANEAGVAAASAPSERGGKMAKPQSVVRVPYVPETVRREIKEELRHEILAQAREEKWGQRDAFPSWIDRFTFYGDLRMRYQGDYFSDDNQPFSVVHIMDSNEAEDDRYYNVTEDRSRFRVRARFGAKVKLNEWAKADFRLATGALDDPVSTNQTMGDYFQRYSVAIDRAYLDLQPYAWFGAMIGRQGNPFYGTDLVWADDLSMDGLVLTLKHDFDLHTKARFLAGVFPLQEVNLQFNADDKWLYGAQAQGEFAFGKDTYFKAGLGYYHYENITGVPSGIENDEVTAASLPQFAQKGNTYANFAFDPNSNQVLFGLVDRYHLLNLTTSIDFPLWSNLRFVATADYVKNIGFDKNRANEEILFDSLDPLTEEDTDGYMIRLQVGTPSIIKLGDWQGFIAYKYLEKDAVLDAFTDSTFLLGGTDAKGYIIGASYGLGKNVWATMRWYSAESISGERTTGGGTVLQGVPFSVDTLQLDLNAKF